MSSYTVQNGRIVKNDTKYKDEELEKMLIEVKNLWTESEEGEVKNDRLQRG